MDTELIIYKGNENKLPLTFKEGALYICVDTGNVYADLNGKNKLLLNSVQKTIDNSFVFGKNNSLTGPDSFISGKNNLIENAGENGVNFIFGSFNNINTETGEFRGIYGTSCAIIGSKNRVGKWYFDKNTRTEVFDDTISAEGCIVLGSSCAASKKYNIAMGYGAKACSDGASANIAIGYQVEASRPNGGQIALGRYYPNTTTPHTNPYPLPSNILLGIAFADDACRTGFNTSGQVLATSMTTTGTGMSGDYAEYFEWADENPNNEDRRGRFVTLDGKKIKYATSENDYILGITSASPVVIGNACELNWQGKYQRDVFGAVIEKETEFEDGVIEIVPQVNPDYDPTQEYIPRSQRQEWSVVGLVGQIVMVDDGSCVVNSHCKPGENGIATHSNEKTKYRVMERIDDSHILVLLK